MSWGGDCGYCQLVGAAVAADALAMGKSFSRLEDAASADFAVSGQYASELLHKLRRMLQDGGLFLAEATETLTHACLRAIRNRPLLLGGKTRAKQLPQFCDGLAQTQLQDGNLSSSRRSQGLKGRRDHWKLSYIAGDLHPST